ncbi:MAG: C13 family peptidase [Pseudohongiellaceae bacterium]|jgi:hypothetical protein
MTWSKSALALLLWATCLGSLPAQAELYITVVQGLGGVEVFERRFTEQREKIAAASETVSPDHVTTFSGEDATRDALLAHFDALTGTLTDDDRVAIYLIGHGSYDGEQFKFNIPGPDITDADLAEVMGSFPGSNHFIVSTASASGAMLEKLETDDRIIITATRNGNEKNATEFGTFFAEALASEVADINKNNNVSIQEAFDFAERETARFFESDGRLATEHPQIRGGGAAAFTLARVQPLETSDDNPRVTELLTRRAQLDSDIESLQLRRNEYSNAEYVERLQKLILESAEVGEQIDMLRGESGANGD